MRDALEAAWFFIKGLVVIILVAAFCIVAVQYARAQHPPQDNSLHHNDYQFWRSPTGASCCSGKDCYPTKAKFSNGGWIAQRREDGAWLSVPGIAIISVISPDGRAHLCAPPPMGESKIVYCFVLPEAGT